jgi:predicted helicase
LTEVFPMKTFIFSTHLQEQELLLLRFAKWFDKCKRFRTQIQTRITRQRNCIVAYYIAAINIENAYHDATPDPDDGIGKENYTSFDGIVLTDTFQLGETIIAKNSISEMFPQNSKRVERQKKAPLRIIIGNPPYSVGQKSANDNAQNQSYPKLDGEELPKHMQNYQVQV